MVSISIAGSDRSLSNDPNIHFGSHHYGKEDNFVGWMSPSIQNSKLAPSHDSWKVEHMEEPKSTEINHVTRDTDIHMHPLLLQNPLKILFIIIILNMAWVLIFLLTFLQEMHNTLTFIQSLLTLKKWNTETLGC